MNECFTNYGGSAVKTGIPLDERHFPHPCLKFSFGMRMTWKSAVVLALAPFIASLAIAPVFAPAHEKLAAAINSPTLKAAAAIKAPLR